jgi:hypothetical protein
MIESIERFAVDEPQPSIGHDLPRVSLFVVAPAHRQSPARSVSETATLPFSVSFLARQ